MPIRSRVKRYNRVVQNAHNCLTLARCGHVGGTKRSGDGGHEHSCRRRFSAEARRETRGAGLAAANEAEHGEAQRQHRPG